MCRENSRMAWNLLSQGNFANYEVGQKKAWYHKYAAVEDTFNQPSICFIENFFQDTKQYDLLCQCWTIKRPFVLYDGEV